MRIGLIAAPWIPVPPPNYGGTELIVDHIARGLAARGHDVRLFTIPESTCPVQKDWVLPKAAEPMGFTVPEAQHVLAAYKAFDDVDVIHDHTVLGPALAAGHKHPDIPVVFTNHNLVTAQNRPLLHAATAVGSLIAISRDQYSRDQDIEISGVIHHGIDIDRYPFGPGGGGYAMFIGRMNPDKGPERAIRIARAAGMPLTMVVKMWEPGEKSFFKDVVEPLLGPDVDLRLTSTREQTIELLQHAEALINPISWHEPFGLVMPEAMSCGTPVLAFARGAAPEIIQHGVTGWLGADEADLARALTRVREFDRATCHAAVEQQFALDRMARDHERLYRRLIKSKQAAATGYSPAEVIAGALRPLARRRRTLAQDNVKPSS
ncbi:MAG: glycosyltransferase family 4 protein [Kineosporiaceae bacterium]